MVPTNEARNAVNIEATITKHIEIAYYLPWQALTQLVYYTDLER